MTEAGLGPPDFLLAGPLRLRGRDGVEAELRPTRLHEILALLLLNADRPVAIADVAGKIWPDKTHANHEFIRPYITRLRQLLDGADAEIDGANAQYTLRIDRDRVDVLRFEQLLTRADHAEEPVARRALLGDALALCPTPELLTGFTRQWVHAGRQQHQQRWDAAVLRRNRLWLEDGRHRQLVAVLRQAGADHTTDPQLARDFLLALYHSGERDEAEQVGVALLRQARQRQSPLESRLANLIKRIGRRDPALDRPGAPAATSRVPNILPPPTGDLAGRRDEMDRMRAHASRTDEAVRVIGIYGPPGIGKTTLATVFAHRYKDQYPGGVLFTDFAGHGNSVRRDVHEVLGLFLSALGVPGEQLSVDPDARLARYRDLVRQRRVLIVLDNVETTAEAAALLPTGPGSLAVVTSRQRLTTLTAVHHAQAIVLETIDDAAAVALLQRLIGTRPDVDTTALREIARICGCYPLALCLIGARLATRPEEPVKAVTDALVTGVGLIPELDRYAERGASVSDVIGLSYRAMDEGASRVFRALGVSPCRSLDVPAVAALCGLDPATTLRALESLLAGHLVTVPAPGRYGMLDLIAEYAAAVDAEPTAVRDALDRLCGHQASTARAYAHRLWPMEVPDDSGLDVDTAEALRWLDDHRDDLITAALHEAGQARPEHVVAIADSLFRYLDHGGYLDDAMRLNRAAVAAAETLGDAQTLADARRRLGAVLIRCGLLDEAVDALERAGQAYFDLGDSRGRAISLGNLARVAARQGRYDDAIAMHEQALTLFRACGDRVGQARTLTNVGLVCEQSGDLGAALRHHTAALELCRTLDIPDATARALGSVAGMLRAEGRLAEAAEHYEQALASFDLLGDRIGAASTLTYLGLLRLDQGNPVGATELHERAQKIFEQAGDPGKTVETLNNLGTAQLAAGRPTAALASHQRALHLADSLGDLGEAARAETGLAQVYAWRASQSPTPREDRTYANVHLANAHRRYERLNVEIPQQLARLSEQLSAD
ncbi:tetratricopeptide repeat protein [Dactylosporangium sp. NPDC051485]|uniref:AfsR/SARP family transcriptional regulator n=1 Tax=Dactylosporangium sp. NPDC051485 TaxID=3154846 RepID=UPI00343E157D